MFRRLAIVGFGLIGGSLGLAVRRAWPDCEVVAIERADAPEMPAARSAGFHVASELAAVTGADVTVLATPVAQNIALLEPLTAHLSGNAVVTDVGSTKRAILAAAQALHRPYAFVGGHPLAGDAPGGFDRARADLFAGKPWLLTPLPGEAQSAAVASIAALAAGIEAYPRLVDAQEHDRLMAYVSHLPQLVASALMHTIGSALGGTHDLALSGTGLLDTTRLAASPASVWIDILQTNADEIGRAVEAFVHAVTGAHPENADSSALRGLLESGNDWRRTLESRIAFQSNVPTQTAAPAWEPRPPASGRGRRRVVATRFYLEMTSPDALKPAALNDASACVEQIRNGPPSFYRYLYREVGRRYHWRERYDWNDERIGRHLARPGLELWLLRVGGAPAGFFELRSADDGNTEIAYFGLLEEFIGRGYGKGLLTAAAKAGWAAGARRLWVHTCSLDHPAALRNYFARGFTLYHQEEYEAWLPG
ncbi:MAG: prephenate dehydrogenase/arogenate dehydrogenase family protein [Luteitalea sp.]|nr:prephenate dehydrogenase/arogenate dehydrogenase family protein [Luteitalea sp.]